MTNNPVKALVTGGRGFIGSHLCVRLAESGVLVYALNRSNTSKNKKYNEFVIQGKILILQGDIIDFNYLNIPKMDYIYHLAGKVSVWGEYSEFEDINYHATERLLQFAKMNPPECFCFFSTASVYGFYGYKNLTEDEKKIPFKNPYPLTKLKTEELVKSFCPANKINYVIIRPCNVYGEYDYTSSYEIYKRIKNEKMILCANGGYLSCFVYIGNFIDASLLLSKNINAYNTDYNVSDGYNETLYGYCAAVAKQFNVKPKFTNVPAPFAKIAANIIECWYKFFRIKTAPLITKFSVYQNCADYNFSIQKLKNTGYSPKINMEEGIKRTIQWFNNEAEIDE